MRFVAAQAVCGRKFTPEAAKTREHFIRTRQPTDSYMAVILDQVDLIAFLEAKLPNKLSGQADGQRVAPFCDLHFSLLSGYTSFYVYQTACMGKPALALKLFL
jgi:hypothetical protein